MEEMSTKIPLKQDLSNSETALKYVKTFYFLQQIFHISLCQEVITFYHEFLREMPGGNGERGFLQAG